MIICIWKMEKFTWKCVKPQFLKYFFLVYSTLHCQSTDRIRIRWKFCGSGSATLEKTVCTVITFVVHRCYVRGQYICFCMKFTAANYIVTGTEEVLKTKYFRIHFLCINFSHTYHFKGLQNKLHYLKMYNIKIKPII